MVKSVCDSLGPLYISGHADDGGRHLPHYPPLGSVLAHLEMGNVDEAALKSRTVGAVDNDHPDTQRVWKLNLAPGRYVLFCNMSGHYLGGMHAQAFTQEHLRLAKSLAIPAAVASVRLGRYHSTTRRPRRWAQAMSGSRRLGSSRPTPSTN